MLLRSLTYQNSVAFYHDTSWLSRLMRISRFTRVAQIKCSNYQDKNILPIYTHDHAAPLWRCRNCGRGFANRNQSHSCGSVSPRITGKSENVRELFNDLLVLTKKSGPAKVLPEKTVSPFKCGCHSSPFRSGETTSFARLSTQQCFGSR